MRSPRLWEKSHRCCDPLCPVAAQIVAWQKANRKMGWEISEREFEAISSPPQLADTDLRDGFKGVILSYGFGEDGQGNADAVMSGKLAWDFAAKGRRQRIWQCEYVDFDQPLRF